MNNSTKWGRDNEDKTRNLNELDTRLKEIDKAYNAGMTAGKINDDENPYLDIDLIDAWEDGFAETNLSEE